MSRFVIQYPGGGKTVLDESGETTYRADGAPIVKIDATGIKVAAQKKRIFAMDSVLRYKHFSKREIEKIMEVK